MEECPSVVRAWTRRDLLADGVAADPVGRLFAHSFPPDRAPDFLVQHEEFFLGSRSSASSHGTAWPYDTHVPLAFVVPGVAPARLGGRVRTVDLAPTLGRLLDAAPDGEIDGVALDLRAP
jgi:hypothetical protein